MLLLLLLLLVSGLGCQAGPRKSHLHRRGVIELADTMGCVGIQNRESYVDYGCYCGTGGFGEPKDETDWCCQRHDCCNNKASATYFGCMPRVTSYSWKCVNQTVQCSPTEDKCQEMLCKCDKEFAQCLAKAKSNTQYASYSQLLCLGKSPSCP